jgi:hypothetical protein
MAARASEAALIQRTSRDTGSAGFGGSAGGASVGTRVALPSGIELKIAGCKVADGSNTGVPLSSVGVPVGVGVIVTSSGAVGTTGGSAGVSISD